jgi:hypothetical protein
MATTPERYLGHRAISSTLRYTARRISSGFLEGRLGGDAGVGRMRPRVPTERDGASPTSPLMRHRPSRWTWSGYTRIRCAGGRTCCERKGIKIPCRLWPREHRQERHFSRSLLCCFNIVSKWPLPEGIFVSERDAPLSGAGYNYSRASAKLLRVGLPTHGDEVGG